MSLPAHLGIRLLLVAILCLAGSVAWTLWDAGARLRMEAGDSADRFAAYFARQPGLGSAGPSAPLGGGPVASTVLTLPPGFCTTIRLGIETPARVCADWDRRAPAPGRFSVAVAMAITGQPALRGIVYRDRVIGEVVAWPDPDAAAARIWREVRLAGGLALALSTATALLGWLATTRLVAPAGRIVRGLEGLGADTSSPSLPRFAAAEFDRIAAACNTLAGRLADVEAERAKLMQRLVEVQEEERQALARNLHDAFGQCLVAVGARAAAIEAAAPPDREDLRDDARGIEAVVATMRECLRGTLARLELPNLAEIGLVDALRGFVADWRVQLRTGPMLHLDVRGDLADLPPDASVSLYRIAQELLTNALRHGRPSRVFLRLERVETDTPNVRLVVSDDGGGDAAVVLARPGRGLTGIRARLSALGGGLSLTGNGNGICASATIPIAGGGRL